MKSELPESWWANGVTQIQPSIFVAYFSNNINALGQREHEGS